jgi:hypothetical protein
VNIFCDRTSGTSGSSYCDDFTLTLSGSGSSSSPYGGTPWPIPGQIEAENFDVGGESVAYHDSDSTNDGGANYRPSEGVDIENTTDTGGGYDVSWTYAGEWLLYTVNVANAGTYTLSERVASNGAGGTFHIEFGGVDKTGEITIPNTGGWQTWTTLQQTVTLSAGAQVMKIAWDSNGATGFVGNLNYVNLTSGSTLSVPNGDFESGSLSPWYVGAGSASVVTGQAHTGTYALEVDGAGGWAGQYLTLTPGQTYTLTAYGKVSGGAVEIGAWDSVNGEKDSSVTSSTSYTELTVTFTPGNSNVNIFCDRTSGTSGSSYCDDFTLTSG